MAAGVGIITAFLLVHYTRLSIRAKMKNDKEIKKMEGVQEDFLKVESLDFSDSLSVQLLADNLEIKPETLKGMLAISAMEKVLKITIVKDPSFFYKIVSIFTKPISLFV